MIGNPGPEGDHRGVLGSGCRGTRLTALCVEERIINIIMCTSL